MLSMLVCFFAFSLKKKNGMSLLLRDVFTIAGQATNQKPCYHEATVVIAAPLSLCASLFYFFLFSQKLLVAAAIWALSYSFFRRRPALPALEPR